jgi:hypothetical protein
MSLQLASDGYKHRKNHMFDKTETILSRYNVNITISFKACLEDLKFSLKHSTINPGAIYLVNEWLANEDFVDRDELRK